VPAPQRTARIEDEIWDPAQARAKTEGASLGALMRAAVHRYAAGDLTSTAEPASQATAELTSQAAPASKGTTAITITGDGEPGHGATCMGPGCWQRDTRLYGLRKLPPSAPPATPPSKATSTNGRPHQAPPGSPAAAQPDQPPGPSPHALPPPARPPRQRRCTPHAPGQDQPAARPGNAASTSPSQAAVQNGSQTLCLVRSRSVTPIDKCHLPRAIGHQHPGRCAEDMNGLVNTDCPADSNGRNPFLVPPYRAPLGRDPG
jgi:hypothetical protein